MGFFSWERFIKFHTSSLMFYSANLDQLYNDFSDKKHHSRRNCKYAFAKYLTLLINFLQSWKKLNYVKKKKQTPKRLRIVSLVVLASNDNKIFQTPSGFL